MLVPKPQQLWQRTATIDSPLDRECLSDLHYCSLALLQCVTLVSHEAVRNCVWKPEPRLVWKCVPAAASVCTTKRV